MNTQRTKTIEITGHLAFWVVPTFLMIRFKIVQFGTELSTAPAIFSFLINVMTNASLVYLVIFGLNPAYFKRRIKKWEYIGLLAVVVLSGALVKISINEFCSRIFTGQWFTKSLVSDLILLEFIFSLFFVIQAIMYGSIKEWIRTTIVNRKLNEEKLTLELKYLKSQINPHFLFNTLNNLYSLALTNNDKKTADGISQLSRMMRYMLKDQVSKTISLNLEQEYLKSYIELQKLRFCETDDISITMSCEGESESVKVPPFLFIGFVENAFKYGIDFKTHSFIDIRFEIKNQTLIFTCSNSVKKDEVIQKNGIGLINIRNRLSLLYPDKHQLMIDQIESTFHVKLEIKLENHE